MWLLFVCPSINKLLKNEMSARNTVLLVSHSLVKSFLKEDSDFYSPFSRNVSYFIYLIANYAFEINWALIGSENEFRILFFIIMNFLTKTQFLCLRLFLAFTFAKTYILILFSRLLKTNLEFFLGFLLGELLYLLITKIEKYE